MLATRRWITIHCCKCRTITTCAALASGHSRWSKIKHDKAKTDASIGKRNSAISSEIIRLTKAFGPDPQVNLSLAQAIASAKKQGYPKQQIESAIARGQGRSASGAVLHNVTLEAMLPGGVAAIIECQTDNKIRTIAEVRNIIAKAEGTHTPTSHFFDKKGRILFENTEALTEEDVFEEAIEAGATDIKLVEDDKFEILTDPSQTTAAMESMSRILGLKACNSEIIWATKEETAVQISDSSALDELIDKIEDYPDVQSVYLNVH